MMVRPVATTSDSMMLVHRAENRFDLNSDVRQQEESAVMLPREVNVTPNKDIVSQEAGGEEEEEYSSRQLESSSIVMNQNS